MINKNLKKICSICMVGVIALSGTYISNVEAASKTTLSTKKVTIPVGKQSKASFSLKKKKQGAKYTYKSSNKKVVTVSSKGILTGVKKGTAKITVTQTLKKKKTKVGTVKVTVKQSVAKNKTTPTLTAQKGSKITLKLADYMNYVNPSATYQFTSNKKAIAPTTKVGKKGTCSVTFNETGIVTFTIKETYKKKNRTIGKVKVVVTDNVIDDGTVDSTPAPEATFDIASFMNDYGTANVDIEFRPFDYIQNKDKAETYSITSSNENVCEVNGETVSTKEEGEATLTIYKNADVLAEVTIKVAYVPLEEMSVDKDNIKVYVNSTNNTGTIQLTVKKGSVAHSTMVVSGDSIQADFDKITGKVTVTAVKEGAGAILFYDKNEKLLTNATVEVIDAATLTVSNIETSVSSVIVGRGEIKEFEKVGTLLYGEFYDAPKVDFTFTVTNHAYAQKCHAIVENPELCSATVTVEKENSDKGTVVVTGLNYGATKISILNSNDDVLATIPVIIAEDGYIEPTSVTVDRDSVEMAEGTDEAICYSVNDASRADYCIFEVEDESICTVAALGHHANGEIEVTGWSVGTTKLHIKTFSGKTLKTISITVTK